MDYKLPKIDEKKVFLAQKNAYEVINSSKEFLDFIKTNNISSQILNDNLSKFLKVDEDTKYCLACPGIQKCKKKMGHFKLWLKYIEEYQRIENIVLPCKYEQVRETIKKDYIFADFKEENLDFSLKDIGQYFPKERLNLVKYLNEISVNQEKGIPSKGVYLEGDHEVGKSFILSVFSKQLASKKLGKIAFINSLNFFEKMNSYLYNDKELFQRKLDEIKNIDFLFIDDFGNEYKTDFIRDNIVFPLITYRGYKGKLTFYTSNYSLDEITQMYGLTKASQIKAKKLVESIKENSKLFSLRGMKFPD